MMAHLRVPRPPEVKTFVRVSPVKVFRGIDISLRPVARAEAKKIVMRRYGLLDLRDRKREVGRLTKILREAWLEDIAKAILGLKW